MKACRLGFSVLCSTGVSCCVAVMKTGPMVALLCAYEQGYAATVSCTAGNRDLQCPSVAWLRVYSMPTYIPCMCHVLCRDGSHSTTSTRAAAYMAKSLRKLRLLSLENGKLWRDLISSLPLIKGAQKNDKERFFIRECSDKTRVIVLN